MWNSRFARRSSNGTFLPVNGCWPCLYTCCACERCAATTCTSSARAADCPTSTTRVAGHQSDFEEDDRTHLDEAIANVHDHSPPQFTLVGEICSRFRPQRRYPVYFFKKRNTCAIHHRLGSVAKYSHFQGHEQVTNLQKALRTPDTRQMLDARPHGFLAWKHFAILQLGLLYMRQCFKVATTVCALFVTTPKKMLVS